MSLGARMPDKKWYIVHTYSGHEAKVKQSLLERAKSFHHEADFDEILIPEENVVEVVKGERRTSKRKFLRCEPYLALASSMACCEISMATTSKP